MNLVYEDNFLPLIYADLHIHSVLSLCADRKAVLPNIFYCLDNVGMEIFAICERNTTRNVRFFYGYGMEYFPHILFLLGMKIATDDEIHILEIFPYRENAGKANQLVGEALVDSGKRPEFFKLQVILNSREEEIGEESKALYLSCGLNLEQTINLLRQYGVIVITRHIDHRSFSVTSQSGFIFENLFDVLGISSVPVRKVLNSGEYTVRDSIYKMPKDIPLITSTDMYLLDKVEFVRTDLKADSLYLEGLESGLQGKIMMEVN